MNLFSLSTAILQLAQAASVRPAQNTERQAAEEKRRMGSGELSKRACGKAAESRAAEKLRPPHADEVFLLSRPDIPGSGHGAERGFFEGRAPLTRPGEPFHAFPEEVPEGDAGKEITGEAPGETRSEGLAKFFSSSIFLCHAEPPARRGAEGKRKVRRSGMVFLPVRFGPHGQNGDAVRVLEEEGPAVPVLFPFEAREDH